MKAPGHMWHDGLPNKDCLMNSGHLRRRIVFKMVDQYSTALIRSDFSVRNSIAPRIATVRHKWLHTVSRQP
jgi:hypothetical protein